MKTLIMLGILTIVFTSCGTLISPETQYERERLIEAYDAARQKHNPERVKEAVKDLLVGKWQYVGLEVEEGSVTAKRAEPLSQQSPNSSPSAADGISEAAPGEASTASNAPNKRQVPDLPNPEATPQTPEAEANATRLPPMRLQMRNRSNGYQGQKPHSSLLLAKTSSLNSLKTAPLTITAVAIAARVSRGNVTSPLSGTAMIHSRLLVFVGGQVQGCLSFYSVPNL